jgi:hypothetical protein
MLTHMCDALCSAAAAPLSAQLVEAVIPGANASAMYKYLHDEPGRIIYACWDRKALESISDDTFRLFLRDQKVSAHQGERISTSCGRCCAPHLVCTVTHSSRALWQLCRQFFIYYYFRVSDDMRNTSQQLRQHIAAAEGAGADCLLCLVTQLHRRADVALHCTRDTP